MNAAWADPSRAAASTAAAALNHLIGSEPWARDALRAHAGKTAKLASPPFSLALTIADDASVRVASIDAVADVTIEVPMSAFASIVSGAMTGAAQAAVMRHARISGDAEFAQVVARLAQGLRWDAEEDASRVIGDAPARVLFASAARANALARDTAARLASSLRDFLVVEQASLVGSADMRTMSDDVARVREHLDRLDKRIARLAR